MMSTPAAAITVYDAGRVPSQGTDPNGMVWYYAEQHTVRSDLTPYYGWRGLKGYIYWKHNGVHNSNGLHYSEPVSMTFTDGGWVQAGITQLNGAFPGVPLNGLWSYYEPIDWLDSGGKDAESYPHYYYSLSAPVYMYVHVKYAYQDQWGGSIWRIRFDDSQHDPVEKKATEEGDIQRGLPSAYGELQQYHPDSGISHPTPELYLGTKQTGYAGPTYALYLQTGDQVWTAWDQSLPAHTSMAMDWHPVWHYSVGGPYYYFGAWDVWP